MPAGPGDIASVENEIDSIRGAMAFDWRETAGASVETLVREFDKGVEPGDAVRASILAAAALRAFADRILAPPRRSLVDRAFRASRRLIVAGVRFAELSGGRLKTRGPTIERLARQAGQALVATSRLRAENPAVAAVVRESAEKLEESVREEREAQRLEDTADELKTDRGRRERKEKAEEVREEAAIKRRQAIDDVREKMKDTRGALTGYIVDTWGYRTFNLGVFLAARASGVKELVARNPLDERTTPFCRWVHGKTVKIEQISKNVDAFLQASKGLDREAIIKSMPFIAQNPGALKKLRADNGGSLQLGFRRHFVNVGVPPYHGRCRTILVPAGKVFSFDPRTGEVSGLTPEPVAA